MFFSVVSSIIYNRSGSGNVFTGLILTFLLVKAAWGLVLRNISRGPLDFFVEYKLL